MIIGRGLIANALVSYDRPDFIFYVNGISNSSIDQISKNGNSEIIELQRILTNNSSKVLIYFSTCMVNSIHEFANSYIHHKYNIELFIKNNFPHYLIVRTSNLVGNNTWNNNTLFNFLANSIRSGSEITINKSVIRNLLDVEEFAYILDKYLQSIQEFNTVVDLVYPLSFSMAKIIVDFENSFGKKFNFKETNKDIFAHFNADLTLSTLLFSKYYKICENGYISGMIDKYYNPKL